MGEVYRARDTRLDRTVALKIIRASELPGRDRVERFKREARAISRVNHPSICALYDIGEEEGATFLVMEYVTGETLANRLERALLRIEEVLRYGVQIAEALDAAHRSSVVHRDLKPSNIMLSQSGVKLLDFRVREAPRHRRRADWRRHDDESRAFGRRAHSWSAAVHGARAARRKARGCAC